MATLCLSTGVPMLTAGDERGRTQRGNNNAYVSDNETSWLDWRDDGVAATCSSSPGPRCGCAGSTRRCGSGTSSPAARRATAGRRTSPGCTRAAGR